MLLSRSASSWSVRLLVLLVVQTASHGVVPRSSKATAHTDQTVSATNGAVQDHPDTRAGNEPADHVATTQELALQVADAQTPEKRGVLLDRNSGLVNEEFASDLLGRATDLRRRGQLDRAAALYLLAASVAERIGDGADLSLAWNDIGLVYQERGEYPIALDRYRQSIGKSESLGDQTGIARALNNEGTIFSQVGEVEAAREVYERSLSIAKQLGNRKMIASARSNLGVVYGREGDYSNALNLLQQSYVEDKTAGSDKGQASDLLNIGNVFLFEGEYLQAGAHFQDAIAVANAGGLKNLQSVGHLGIGRIAEIEGRFDTAMEEFTSALHIAEEAEDRFDATMALTYLGDACSWLGKPEEALTYFSKGRDQLREMGATSDLVDVLTRMADAYQRAGHSEAALRTAHEAADEGSRLGARDMVWRAHLVAGDNYLRMQEPARAKAEFGQAIQLIEDVRGDIGGSASGRETYLASNIAPYQRMLALSAKEHDADGTFSFAERAKSRVLMDMLQGSRTDLRAQMTPEEKKQDDELKLRMASFNTQILAAQHGPKRDGSRLVENGAGLDKARLDYGAFEATVFANHPDARSKTGQIEPISLQKAAKLLPRNTALIEYAVTEDTLYTIVISSGTTGHRTTSRVFSSPVKLDELRKQVGALREAMEERSPGVRRAASVLFREVLAPAMPSLAGKTVLVIVPDGPLWGVPIYALPMPQGGFVIDRFTIAYSPSATALNAMSEVRRARHNSAATLELLAMGNPAPRAETRDRVASIHRDVEYSPLPSAEREVQQLQRMYGTSASEVFVGSQAQESIFKTEAPKARVIHLATHATLDSKSPMYSHLLLAAEKPGSTEDGLLETWEILRLDLHAELAVLSACATARGEEAPGEGVVGLSWAFFVAGVPAVVVSQWRVQSDSTSALMIDFHHNRRNNALNDAQALRAAALAVRRTPGFEHPFYWAPFIVVGAGF